MASSTKNTHDESSSLVFEITLGISRNLETPRRMTLLLESSICNSYKYIDLLNLNETLLCWMILFPSYAYSESYSEVLLLNDYY